MPKQDVEYSNSMYSTYLAPAYSCLYISIYQHTVHVLPVKSEYRGNVKQKSAGVVGYMKGLSLSVPEYIQYIHTDIHPPTHQPTRVFNNSR